VTLIVRAHQPVRFPLYLRVPGWCAQPSVAINNQPQGVPGGRQPFLRIERDWSDGDAVRLTLPMTIQLRRWAKNHHSVSVDRGPLTYSLKIAERYVQAGGTEDWPAFEILPESPWNYGLVLDGDQPAAAWEIVKKDWPVDEMPFTHEGTPLEIRAQGKRIPQWQLDPYGLVAELQDSPVRSEQPVEEIRLIPMGAARLRISSFPVIGEGPEATAWKEPTGSAAP